MDNGTWSICTGNKDVNYYIVSSDFTHDVAIQVTGDFATIDEEFAYCQWLRDKLNENKD